MLEKPDIADELIISQLQKQYGLQIVQLEFLPLGADMGTAVYRVVTDDGNRYFLKLRKGFDDITVTIPLFLKSQGIQEIIAPIETKSNQGWADVGEYKMILYPFIEGEDGFDRDLTDHHRRILGSAFRKIHAARIPPTLESLIPNESFSSYWRDSLNMLQKQVENNFFADATAAKLAEFMKLRRDEISHLVERADQLALELQSKPLEFVLCHSDIHSGNILIRANGQLAEHPGGAPFIHIVDWDNPILAPKERDLMFIGGGIDNIWKSEREEAVFYEGYGNTDIDLKVLAYYRYERIIEDLAVIGEQLLLSNEGGADRERSYGWFTSNFEPGSTIEIAKKTDELSLRARK